MDYDANPVSGHVQYSFDEYKEYYMFSLFKGKRYRLRKRLFFICFPIMIVYITASAFFVYYDSFIFLCDGLLISIFTYSLFMISYFPGKRYKQTEKLFSAGVSYKFRNNDFFVNQSNDLYSGESVVKYESIFKVYETGTMFYVFLSPRQAFLINKNGLTNGNPSDIREILRSKLGSKKYIRCN